MNTESGRLSNLMANSRACMAAESLAKARALGQRGCGGGSCTLIGSTPLPPPVPAASTDLKSRVANCVYKYQSPEAGVPESVRIARVQQRTLDLSLDPNNPDARFSQYRRPFIQVCPPIPQWYYTAGEPVLQGPCNIGTDSAEVAAAFAANPTNPVLPG